MGWTKAVWSNGKKQITGRWTYNWPSDSFTITLDSKDRITGQYRTIHTYNDVPEWGNWTRIVKKRVVYEK